MTFSKGTALVAVSLTLGGCNNILDLQDPAAVNETQVWNDSALADAYVNRVYADNLPGWSTGDATTSDESPGGTDQLYGQLTASSQCNRPTPDLQRWQTAYDANLAARDYLAAHGFGLYPSFEQLWFVDMNPEAIFVRRYSYPVSTHNWQAATRPLDESQNATGANRPTWQMVKAFPMKNGRPITDSTSSPAYDSVYFWKNRDPRFYATIAYNGAVWA